MSEQIFLGLEPDLYIQWVEFCRQKKLEEAKRVSDQSTKERLEREARELEIQKESTQKLFRAMEFSESMKRKTLEELKESKRQDQGAMYLPLSARETAGQELLVLEQLEKSLGEFLRGKEGSEFKTFFAQRETESRKPIWERTRESGDRMREHLPRRF